MTRTLILLAALATIGWAMPETADAQYHGVTHHRTSRRASRARRPGWNQPQQQEVPELDPRAAGSAVALLLGGVVVVLGRSRKAAKLAG